MFSRLTTVGKTIVGVILAAGLFVAGWFIFPYFQDSGIIKGSNNPDLIIGLNTWSGFAPVVWYNDGKNSDPVTNNYIANSDCKMSKDFGLGLQINQMDKRENCIDALLADKVDAIYVTTDVFSPEIPTAGELAKAGVVQWLKVDDSRGADVVVATKNIRSVNDFTKNTKVACAFPTASSTLLLELLDAGGKTIGDITVIYVENAMAASEQFRNGNVDVAVVWSPDDGDCLADVEGSHVLFSTKHATSIVMDGMLAKRSTIEKKHVEFEKLAKAWLSANADMQSESNKTLAAQAFSTSFGFELFLVEDGVAKIRFSTLGDNKAFFGLDPTYSGVTGNDLYTRMAKVYSKTPKDVGGGFYANNPVPWIKASYAGVIEKVELNGPQHGVEGQLTFTPSTKETKSMMAVATKQITILFETNSDKLDNMAKAVIDRQVSGTLKGWQGARVRIEGNTDVTGDYNYNKALSSRRAMAVKDYLVKTYGFDPNRIDVVGNGCDKPANGSSDIKSANATEDLRSQNRRTDFGLIAE